MLDETSDGCIDDLPGRQAISPVDVGDPVPLHLVVVDSQVDSARRPGLVGSFEIYSEMSRAFSFAFSSFIIPSSILAIL